MPPPEATLEEVAKEVKNDVKGLNESVKGVKESFEGLEKSLHDLRTDYEEAKSKGDEELGQFKEKHEKQITDFMTRMESFDELIKKANERIDNAETFMTRPEFQGAETPEDRKALLKEAREFKASYFAVRGKRFTEEDLEEVDYDEMKEYNRVFRKFLRKGDDATKGAKPEDVKALQAGVDPDGGYLVTPQVSNRIVQKMFEISPIRSIATIERISTDIFRIPVDKEDVDLEWVGETNLPSTSGTPKVDMKEIPAHEVATRPKAYQQLLEDAAYDVEGWLARKLADRFARGEATEFVKGNSPAKPRGFTTYPAGTSWGQIQQIATGADSSYTYAGLINIMTALKEKYLTNAVWVTNRASMAKFLVLQDGANQYIFAPSLLQGPGGVRVFSPVLLGFPLKLAADMPALATNSLSCAFGDFREGYIIVDRLGMTVQRDPFTQKPAIEFYTRKRVGGDVVNFEAIVLGKCNT